MHKGCKNRRVGGMRGHKDKKGERGVRVQGQER